MLAGIALLFVQVSVTLPGLSCGCSDGVQATRPEAGLPVGGTIRDSAGGAISGAAIVIRSGLREQHVVSGADGRFSAATSATGEIEVVVRAPGFAELRQTIAAGAPRTNLDLVVIPEGIVPSLSALNSAPEAAMLLPQKRP